MHLHTLHTLTIVCMHPHTHTHYSVQLFTAKELRGQTSIVKINFSHPVMQQHVPLPLTDASAPAPIETTASSKASKAEPASKTSGPAGAMNPVKVYQSTALSQKILEAGDAFTDKKDSSCALFTKEEIHKALEKAFKKMASPDNYPSLNGDADTTKETGKGTAKETDEEKIEWMDFITREQGLSTLCLSKVERKEGKETGRWVTLSEDEMVARFIKNGMKVVTLMLRASDDLAAALRDPSGFPMIEADAKIMVSIQKTKRFVRTRVAGIHLFPNLEPKRVAEVLQKACAASASVCEIDDVKGVKKPLGVVVQGSVVNEVCNVLQNHYGLPKAMIQIQR